MIYSIQIKYMEIDYSFYFRDKSVAELFAKGFYNGLNEKGQEGLQFEFTEHKIYETIEDTRQVFEMMGMVMTKEEEE